MHEQFGKTPSQHSEFKTDLDLERLPSGKFDTNYLVCQLAALAMNLLRLIMKTIKSGLTGQGKPKANFDSCGAITPENPRPGVFRILRMAGAVDLTELLERMGKSQAENRVASFEVTDSGIYRELQALGASSKVAVQVAGNASRWWHNSGRAIESILTSACFDRLGVT